MAPFQSSKQRAYLFAKKPEVAKKFVQHSKGQQQRPQKKGK